jgi:hypothetical protein
MSLTSVSVSFEGLYYIVFVEVLYMVDQEPISNPFSIFRQELVNDWVTLKMSFP